MPDDLSSIEGLADKHVRALARQQVTDLRGLVQADQSAIYRAMANLRPRPTLEQISRWQDDARNRLAETASLGMADGGLVRGGLQPAARMGDTWERRVEAEQTEVEPERHPQVWSGWDVRARLRLDARPAGPGRRRRAQPRKSHRRGAARGAGRRRGPAPARAAPAPGPASRAQLRIDSAALIDATGRTEVVTAGVLAANPRTELVAPVRVVFTVGGAPPGTRLQAVARIQRPDGPGWNPRDPVVLAGPGQAEFDLTPVPAGDHEMALIAWAPDATAKPVSVRLPRVTIRQEPG